jgi:tetratricopeptide (TPR) repeat protein
MEQFDAEMSVYDRKAEAVRRERVDLDMHQGWVLTDYFYGELTQMEKQGTGLKEYIGQMIYGMDVDSERHREEKIVFLPEGSGGDHVYGDAVRRTPRPVTGLELAERKLMKGDLEGAEVLAEAALKAGPSNDEAHFLLGRIDLMEGDPDGALDHLTQTVKLSHDPRTIAWAHIYLGRMYDIERDPDNPEAIKPQREKAIAEYRAALANRDSQIDTKEAAERGIKQPFTLPKRAASSSDQEKNSPAGDPSLDPTGKAEKEAYQPTQ